ncbi:hypothetical protein KI387_026154, partial [Taxus chinensis]
MEQRKGMEATTFVQNYTIIGETPKSLRPLDVSENALIGSIPYLIRELSSLSIMYMNANRLTDNIPLSIGNVFNCLGLFCVLPSQISWNPTIQRSNILNERPDGFIQRIRTEGREEVDNKRPTNEKRHTVHRYSTLDLSPILSGTSRGRNFAEGSEAGSLRRAFDVEEFRENAHKMVDFIADYYRDIHKFPVRSQVQGSSIYCDPQLAAISPIRLFLIEGQPSHSGCMLLTILMKSAFSTAKTTLYERYQVFSSPSNNYNLRYANNIQTAHAKLLLKRCLIWSMAGISLVYGYKSFIFSACGVTLIFAILSKDLGMLVNR